jgi:phosphoserine phosphatase RsbU/P
MNDEVNNKGNILVVDDKPDNLRLLVNLLSEQGYKVRPVPSGKLALSGAQAIPPDIILLDVMMPEMDGFEVCKRLKKNNETKDIPIIFLTAKVETNDIVKGFDMGGADYVCKPFQTAELLARIKTQIGFKKAKEEIKTLQGLIPICASCKKVRDDEGLWSQIESYIEHRSDALFSHGICPDCLEEIYPQQYQKMKNEGKI